MVHLVWQMKSLILVAMIGCFGYTDQRMSAIKNCEKFNIYFIYFRFDNIS